MKASILFTLILLSSSLATAQKFLTEKGTISFFSDAAIEDITAENTMVGSLFNATTGELVFIVKIKDFIFPKALMREHFNEKYMETEKFPKSLFTGKLKGYTLTDKGEQNVTATGKLTIHGVTRDVEVPGTIVFDSGKAMMKGKFMVALKDYDIKIPKLVWQNIAEEIEVKIDFVYKPMK
ncbi:MAG TPA: YceI family protein [Chryseosolibacter sp.]